MVNTQHLGIGLQRAVNLKRGTVVANRVLTALTMLDRRMGLLTRPKLRMGEGLHIVPCDSIHTVGMTYSIDVVFLDEDGLVLATWRDVQPGRNGIRCDRAVSALEVLCGSLDVGWQTQAGDILEFQEATC
jgi:uncharacterized membrane protein (UPF0127 family)